MRRYAVTLSGGEAVEVDVQDEAGEAGAPRRVKVVVGGTERVLEVRGGGGRYSWVDGTRVVNVDVEPKGTKLAIAVRGESFVGEVADARALQIPQVGRAGGKAGPLTIRAPMPGRVVKLLAKPGEDVKAGRGLLVVEAMKMENELRAPRDGRVQEAKVKEGDAVEAGEELMILV